jgi:hypothetical protein
LLRFKHTKYHTMKVKAANRFSIASLELGQRVSSCLVAAIIRWTTYALNDLHNKLVNLQQATA